MLSPEMRMRLEQLTRWRNRITNERDETIYLARLQGASYREIGEAVGLSHPKVMEVVAKRELLAGAWAEWEREVRSSRAVAPDDEADVADDDDAHDDPEIDGH